MRGSNNIRHIFYLSKVPFNNPCNGYGSLNDVNAKKVGFFYKWNKRILLVSLSLSNVKLIAFLSGYHHFIIKKIKFVKSQENASVKGLSRAIFSKLTHQNYLIFLIIRKLKHYLDNRIQSKIYSVKTLEQD